jgi:hypothetical protein
VARIRTPLLQNFGMTFLNQLIFDVRQLSLFIGYTGMPRSFSHAIVGFWYDSCKVVLYPQGETNLSQRLVLRVLCRGLDWQVSSTAQIVTQSSSLLAGAERLDILKYHNDRTLQVDTDNTKWLELFHPFAAVRTLRISHPLSSLIVPALRELTGEMATEVLPALDSLYLEEYQPTGSEHQAIEPFIATRQSSDHPLTIHPLSGCRNDTFMPGLSRVVSII